MRWIAIALTLAARAHAEESADDASSTLPSVQVTGHYADPVDSSDAASQGVILGSLLQDIPLSRPAAVLETIPGLVVTQHSGEGKANQYFLRGYNLDHGTDFATSVDGVPVNMPTNAHGQGYSDLNFLIPEIVDRIEYRKGPYFAQNGDFSSAGSAEIRYRDALDRPLLDLTLGSYGYRRVLAAGSWPLARGDSGDGVPPQLLTALEVEANDGPWVHPDSLGKFNMLLRASGGDADRGWSADAQSYAAHWDATDQIPLAAIDAGELCRFCALDPSDGGRSARDILSGEWHVRDYGGYLKASAYLEHYRLQLWSDFTYFENDPLHGDQFGQHDARDIFGGAVAQGWLHTLLGRDSTTEVGVQWRHDAIHVALTDTQARVPFATVGDDLVAETQGAVYVENTTAWAGWLRTLAGLRVDSTRLDLTAQTSPADNGSASASRISPKLAAVFGPWAHTEFFVDLGAGFHSNDARGVISRYDPTTGMPADRAPALVGSQGREVGVRTEIVPGLQSSLALWRLDSASELVYVADSSGTEINGASRRRGLEWDNHVDLSSWLLFDADLAWTHARYAGANANRETGNQIPNAVAKVASVGLSLHGVGRWSADFKLRYIGGYPLSQDGALRAPAAVTSDVRLQRVLTDSASLSFDVINLFDRKYYDIAYEQDYRLTPTSPVVSGVTAHPGEPRQLRMTLRWSF